MELSQETFRELAERIHGLCGLSIGPDKTYLVRHRLEPLIRSEGLDGFQHLVDRLRVGREARLQEAVVEAVITQETSFFRDPALFKAIQERVLPECVSMLRKPAAQRHRVRIWSAAASTGQEAYSLAMLIRDLVESDFSKELKDSHFSILASDISAKAIETAKAASYGRTEVARGVPEQQLHRYFRHRGNRWTLDETVRRMVHFRRFNLLHSPAELGPFDVILCRNVLIYFDEPTRRKICRQLCAILQDGGWLVLGAAESLYGIESGMETVKAGRMLLYRKP